MNFIMYKKLEEFVDNGELIGIYSDPDDPEHYDLGFIAAMDEDDIVLAAIDNDGRYDGYVLIHIQDIFQIEYETSYIEKITKLHSMRKRKHKSVVFGDDFVLSILKLAKEDHLIVSITIENSDDTNEGFVVELDESNLKLCIIDTIGKADGTMYIDVASITDICCDSGWEQGIKLVYEK